jgi:hypothetical protein
LSSEHEDRGAKFRDGAEADVADFSKQELANIIDTEAFQSMMDDLYAVTKIGFAIIDLKGNVLASAGWQEICMNFHRKNPQTLWNCLESDIVLSQGVAQGNLGLINVRITCVILSLL